jgi:hypothetical protein
MRPHRASSFPDNAVQSSSLHNRYDEGRKPIFKSLVSKLFSTQPMLSHILDDKIVYSTTIIETGCGPLQCLPTISSRQDLVIKGLARADFVALVRTY